MIITDLKIELDGVVGTIAQYTMNPYVTGYTATLRRAIEENDVEMMKISISKILQWYDTNWNAIMKNEYVMNKQDHIKTKSILERALETIQKESTKS